MHTGMSMVVDNQEATRFQHPDIDIETRYALQDPNEGLLLVNPKKLVPERYCSSSSSMSPYRYSLPLLLLPLLLLVMKIDRRYCICWTVEIFSATSSPLIWYSFFDERSSRAMLRVVLGWNGLGWGRVLVFDSLLGLSSSCLIDRLFGIGKMCLRCCGLCCWSIGRSVNGRGGGLDFRVWRARCNNPRTNFSAHG